MLTIIGDRNHTSVRLESKTVIFSFFFFFSPSVNRPKARRHARIVRKQRDIRMRRPGQSETDDILVVANQRYRFVPERKLERIPRGRHERLRVHVGRARKYMSRVR